MRLIRALLPLLAVLAGCRPTEPGHLAGGPSGDAVRQSTIHTAQGPPDNFTGIWRWRSEDGWVFHETYSNGVLNGLDTAFYPGGARHSETGIKSRKMHGRQIFWSKTGIKVEERTFHLGSLDGPYRSWFPAGQAHIEGTYSNGSPVGRWIARDRMGRKRTDAVFGQAKPGRQIHVQAWDETGSIVLDKKIMDVEGTGMDTSLTTADLVKMDKRIPIVPGPAR